MAACFSCFGQLGSGSERHRFLTAAKNGNDHAAAASLANNPDLVMSTTLLQRKTALHLAAEAGHVAVMASVLEMLLVSASGCVDEGGFKASGTSSGSDAELQVSAIINSRDSEGRTPLIVACAHGHSDCVRLLMSNGAWREPVDSRGNSALHYAAARGHLGILLSLLTDFQDELRAEQQELHVPGPLPCLTRLVDQHNMAGFVPLAYAVWSKQSGAVQVLLQHGSDLIARNTHAGVEQSIPCPGGSTPLHLAAMKGHIEISRLLLKTHYERVMEPMLLALAAGGGGRESTEAVTRRMLEVDPRTQVNSMGLVPYKVAQRAGYLSLASLLKPHIPLARLFNEEEHRQRFYGPPALKLLAAEALNRKLLASLERVMAPEVAVSPDKTTPLAPATAVAPFVLHAVDGSAGTTAVQPAIQPRADAVPTQPATPPAAATPNGWAPAGQHRPGEQKSGENRNGSAMVRSQSTAGALLAPVREDEENSNGLTSPTQDSNASLSMSPRSRGKTGPVNSLPVSPFASISLDANEGIAEVHHEVHHGVRPVSVSALPTAELPDGPQSTGEINFNQPLSSAQASTRSIDGSGMPASTSQSPGVLLSPAVLAQRTSASSSGAAPSTRQHATHQLSPARSASPSVLADGQLSAATPGTTALHRGRSITLTGAGGRALGSTSNMAQVMGLEELSSVIEDKPTNLRMRGASCMPRLGSIQHLHFEEDEDDINAPPMFPNSPSIIPLSPQRSLEHPLQDAPSSPSMVLRGSIPSPAATPPPGGTMRAVRRTLSGLRRTISASQAAAPEIGISGASANLDLEAHKSQGVRNGGQQGAQEDEDENECGVCMEHPALVLVQPCNHAMCGPCAKKMLLLAAQRSPHCPFCRAVISDFKQNAVCMGNNCKSIPCSLG